MTQAEQAAGNVTQPHVGDARTKGDVERREADAGLRQVAEAEVAGVVAGPEVERLERGQAADAAEAGVRDVGAEAEIEPPQRRDVATTAAPPSLLKHAQCGITHFLTVLQDELFQRRHPCCRRVCDVILIVFVQPFSCCFHCCSAAAGEKTDAGVRDEPAGAQIEPAQAVAHARGRHNAQRVVGEPSAAAEIQAFQGRTGGGHGGEAFVGDPFAHGEVEGGEVGERGGGAAPLREEGILQHTVSDVITTYTKNRTVIYKLLFKAWRRLGNSVFASN